MSEMTDTIYSFVAHYLREKRFSPTLREIAAGCEVSTNTVRAHLDVLEALGKISRTPRQARSIRLSESDSEPDPTTEAVYAYVHDALTEGLHPSQQQIADDLYLSRPDVRRHLLRLEAEGRLQREDGQRQLRLPDGE